MIDRLEQLARRERRRRPLPLAVVPGGRVEVEARRGARRRCGRGRGGGAGRGRERELDEEVRDGREDVEHDRVDVAHEVLPQHAAVVVHARRVPHAVDRLQEIAVRGVERERELRGIASVRRGRARGGGRTR